MANVKKGILSQGTKVYIKHGNEITRMDCIKALQLGDDSLTEVDTTSIDSLKSKTSRLGTATHSEGSITINTDLKNESHLKLLQLASNLSDVQVAIGWSDGIVEPIINADGNLEVPEGRTFTSFSATLIEKSPTFEADALVSHVIGMKRQTRAITNYDSTGTYVPPINPTNPINPPTDPVDDGSNQYYADRDPTNAVYSSNYNLDNMKFNTTNPSDLGFIEMYLQVKDLGADWILTRNGTVVASSIYTSPNYTVDIISPTEIKIGHLPAGTAGANHYEFSGTASRIILGLDNNSTGLSTGVINVVQYLYGTGNFQFPVKQMKLNIPTALPVDVTNLESMFRNATNFNQNISAWNVSNITSMSRMFNNATIFNQNIGAWNTAKVIDMTDIFLGADAFNQDLSGWDVMNIHSYDDTQNPNWILPRPSWGNNINEPLRFSTESYLVADKEAYVKLTIPNTSTDWVLYDDDTEEVLGNYTGTVVVTGVTKSAITGSTVLVIWRDGAKTRSFRLEGTLATLKVEHLTTTGSGAIECNMTVANFSGKIAGYQFLTYKTNLVLPNRLPSCVTSTKDMFKDNILFNGDISNWNVSSVTNMSGMFYNATIFNQNIGTWNTTNVTNMSYMFYNAYAFNQNISNWNTANVTNMTYMFYYAYAFNQDLSGWNVVKIPTAPTTSFSSGTVWKLPKPVWGANPSADISHLPYYEDRDPNSVNYAVTDTSKLRFNTDNVATLDDYTAFYRFRGLGGVWSLTVDGLLIADSTGLNNPHYYIYRDPNTNYMTFRDYTGKIGKRNYEFSGTLTEFEASILSEAARGNINIVQLLPTDSKYRFTSFNLNLTVPTTLPATVTNLSNIFNKAYKFNQDLSGWNVSNIIDMSYMFSDARVFNQNISNWNTANVTNMNSMFTYAYAFNQNIGAWNVAKVTTMSAMFYNASAFNQNLSAWNTVNVTNMNIMFYSASAFNQNLSTWNVVKIPTAPTSFSTSSVYKLPKPVWGANPNADISSMPYFPARDPSSPSYVASNGNFRFNTISTNALDATFALRFYGYVGTWKLTEDGVLIADSEGMRNPRYTPITTGTSTIGAYMEIQLNAGSLGTKNYEFSGQTNIVYVSANAMPLTVIEANAIQCNVTQFSDLATNYRLYLSNLTLTVPTTLAPSVTDMSYMFYNTKAFNQNISTWNTANVTNMSYMFYDAYAFNQNISNWNTANVTNMNSMFTYAYAFNQNIGAWNVAKVTNMTQMFYSASAFNQNLSTWCVTNITTAPSSFSVSSPLTTVNKPVWGTCPVVP